MTDKVKVEVKDVVKKFDKVVALNHLSFKVREGEILSLLGPSGCGKTTALRVIAGFEDIDEGEVLLDGVVVTSPHKKILIPPEKRNLGLVFQSYALWPHMTVYDNIAYPLKLRKVPKNEIDEKVKNVLELVGLSGLENRYPSQLSGGQQQRVALARSLVYEPKLLLLDEPLSNLDLRVREAMRGELRRILKKIGITAIYVTHDQEEAFVISDRILLMRNGKKIQEGTPRQIYDHPANLFVAEFIGKSNIFKADVKIINEQERLARVIVPDLSADLLCKYPPGMDINNSSLIAIRYNEIRICESKPNVEENVLKGEIVAQEYRGAFTDYKIQIGKSYINVTLEKPIEAKKKEVYLYIPPESIKLIPSTE